MQSERFSAKLDSIGFSHQLGFFETNHSFSNIRPELDSIWLNWFDKTLKDSKKRVAITIDDVPNTKDFKSYNFRSELLDELDQLLIPVTIFINEGRVCRDDSIKNKELLESWIVNAYVSPANQTYAHTRYSESGFEVFTADVIKGERLSRELASKYNKNLNYFVFHSMIWGKIPFSTCK